MLLSPVPLQVPDNFRPFQLPTNSHVHNSIPGMVLEVTIQSSDPVAVCSFGQPQEIKRGKNWNRLVMKDEADLMAFSRKGLWLNYMNFADLMLSCERPILHASAILYHGKSWLFVAPSGGGKSTQAELWESYYGGEILNGDKVILEIQGKDIYAHGGPVSGSSGVYRNKCAPLGGIFVVKKSDGNWLERVLGFHRLLILYSNAVKSWKGDGLNQTLLDLLKEVSDRVPIYQFYCTNSLDATRYLHQELFEEVESDG